MGVARSLEKKTQLYLYCVLITKSAEYARQENDIAAARMDDYMQLFIANTFRACRRQRAQISFFGQIEASAIHTLTMRVNSRQSAYW